MTQSDQRTEATHTRSHTCTQASYNLSEMKVNRASSASDQPLNVTVFFSLYLPLPPSAERGGHKLLTELQADTEAECGGVSRQGKSRQEEEEANAAGSERTETQQHANNQPLSQYYSLRGWAFN